MSVISFILEHKKNIDKFDLAGYKSMMGIVNEGVVGDIVSSSFGYDMYLKYIDTTLDNFTNTTNNIDELVNFYSMIYKSAYLDDKEITIPVKSNVNIKKIRSEYLLTLSKDFNTNTMSILSGQVTRNDDLDAAFRAKYMSPVYEDTLKRQIVDSNIRVVDFKEMFQYDNPSMVKVDSFYIQNNMIPFLKSYMQIYNDLYKLGNTIKTNIKLCYNRIIATDSSLNLVSKDPKIRNMYGVYKYNTLRIFMNLSAYTVSMFIKKVTDLTYNIMQYNYLYNEIHNYFPEGKLVLHEAVIDSKIDDIDDTVLFNSIISGKFNVVLPYIQSMVNRTKMQISNILSTNYNYKINFMDDLKSDEYPYDIYTYASVNKTITDIIEKVHSFEMNVKDEELVLDDVLIKSGLAESFIVQYSDILSNFTTTNYYTSGGLDDLNKFLCMFNDLNHYEKNINIISSNIGKCYYYITQLNKKYETNTDEMEMNRYNEVKSILDQILKNFKDYVLLVAKKIVDRLVELTNYIDTVDITNDEFDLSKPEPFVPYDYNIDVALNEYVTMEREQDNLFKHLMFEYKANRTYKEKGIKYISEDVSDAGDNKTGVTGVNTNDNNNDNNNGNNGNNDKGGSIIDSFKKLIDRIINKFRNTFKALAKNDASTLRDLKTRVDDLNTDNMSITCINWEKCNSEQIGKDIESVEREVNNITIEALTNEDNVAGKLLNGLTHGDGDNNLSDKIKDHYKLNKNGNLENAKYTKDDCKTKIHGVLDFLINYQDNSGKIADALHKLEEAAADKQKKLNEQPDSSEGDDGKPKTDTGNETNKNHLITKVVTDYTGAVLSVYESKYYEYRKIARAVFPKNSNALNKKVEVNNDNNTENNDTNENKTES